jgi:hypothetical protein
MTPDTNNTERTEAIHRHLALNAAACIRHNIIVHVDSINASQTVAICSVEQRNKGLLRRTYSVQELIWRTEQALAPLTGLGVVPLINVRHEELLNTSPTATRNARSPMDWIQRLKGWLGYPLAREFFGTSAPVSDPFGLYKAMQTSTGK